MKTSLREIRVEAIKLLYKMDFYDNFKGIDTINNIETQEVRDYVSGVCSKIEVIDDIISKNLVNYTLGRLNIVDRAIIRLATFELLNNVAPTISINEAIEITKEYSDSGDKKATAFNNKLLDQISNYIKKMA